MNRLRRTVNNLNLSRFRFHFQLAAFLLLVYGGYLAINIGDQLPYVPRHQYSLGLRYRHESGFKCSVLSTSWGSYYMDNANTEKYDGYDFVTSLMAGYEWDHFDFRVNVENLFDKQFANEVTKDTSGAVKYTPAAPQTVIARIGYKF